MTKYVAFLRGINVGGRIIKMTDLKACFEKMGFKNVSTLLQSGNVIFEGDFNNLSQVKQKIEAGLSKTFSYPAKVQVFPLQKIAAIIKDCPFNFSDEKYQHYVIFFESNLAAQLADETIALDNKVEEIRAGDGVIYWRVQKGMTLKSEFSKNLTKAKYKQFNTNRNLRTLQKIANKAQ